MVDTTSGDYNMGFLVGEAKTREEYKNAPSLRDQFAMAALPMCWHPDYITPPEIYEQGVNSKDAAEMAYKLADAMLQARQQGNKQDD